MSDHTDEDDDLEPSGGAAGPDRGRRPGRQARGGRGAAAVTAEDDYDDDFYDDDYDEYERRPRSRRDTYLLAAAALVVLAVVGVLIARSVGDEDSGNGSAGPTSDQGDPSETGPPDKNWPSTVAGAAPAGFISDQSSPDLGQLDPAAPSPAPGVYVWTDFKGWHIRLVPGPDLSAVSGSVAGGSAIEVQPTTIGGATVTPTGSGAEFQLSGDGALVGFDFDSQASETLTLNLTGVQPSRVYTGQSATPADGLPLEYTKSAGQ